MMTDEMAMAECERLCIHLETAIADMESSGVPAQAIAATLFIIALKGNMRGLGIRATREALDELAETMRRLEAVHVQ